MGLRRRRLALYWRRFFSITVAQVLETLRSYLIGHLSFETSQNFLGQRFYSVNPCPNPHGLVLVNGQSES